MTEYVFKRKRNKNGRTVTDRTYCGRYKLAGDANYTTVNLEVTDKQVAQQKLRQLIQEFEREQAGIGVSKAESDCLNAPLSDLLHGFVGELERLGRASEYTRHVSARVLALSKACGWVRLRDVSADSFRQWRKVKKASDKTINEYQNSITALLNWIGKNKRVKLPVFEFVEHIDARGRQSFERRALTVLESCALLSCAPLKRRVSYALALYTALRRGEIEALEWRDVSLDSETPFLSVRASTTKNSKPAHIPLHPDLVAILREWCNADADESDLVLPDGIPQNRLGLWVDLKNAGIERADTCKRRVDFHALRHTSCTLLMAAGVPARVVQEIMRHSDMRLTTKIYTDAGGIPTTEAINKMPSLLVSKNGTHIGTLTLGFKGQSVSRAVTAEKKTPDAQLVDFQAVVPACHNLSASGAFRGMAERGGFEPNAIFLTCFFAQKHEQKRVETCSVLMSV